jgi:hypothetical protein
MSKAREIAEIISTPPSIYSTDAEVAATYLTQSSASTTYATNASMKKIVQIVYGSTGTEASTSSSNFSDTNLTATITPTSASNKILVIISQNSCGKSLSDTSMRIKVFRGATEIGYIVNDGGKTGSSIRHEFGSVSANILDTPATTSSITYKTTFNSWNNSAITFVQSGGAISNIILMEVTP